MKKYLAIILTAFVSVNVSRADNPIVQTHFTPDPAPMVYNGSLYLYTGHDEDKSTWFTMKAGTAILPPIWSTGQIEGQPFLSRPLNGATKKHGLDNAFFEMENFIGMYLSTNRTAREWLLGWPCRTNRRARLKRHWVSR